MNAALTVRAPSAAAIVKRCGCGCAFSAATWAALPLVGIMQDEVETIELRNCTCGSTLAVEVSS